MSLDPQLDPKTAILVYKAKVIGIQHTRTSFKFDIKITPDGIYVIALGTYGGATGGKKGSEWTQPAFNTGDEFRLDLFDKGDPTESKKLLLKANRASDGASLTLKFKGKSKISLIREIIDEQYGAELAHKRKKKRIREQSLAYQQIEQEKLDGLMAKELAETERKAQQKAILAKIQAAKEKREDEEKAEELVYERTRRSTVLSAAKKEGVLHARMEYSNDLDYDSMDGFDNANMVPLPYNNINNEWSSYNGYHQSQLASGNVFSSGDASIYVLTAVLVVVFLFLMTVACCVFGAIVGYVSSVVMGKRNKNVENNQVLDEEHNNI